MKKRNETRGERGNETSSRSVFNVCAIILSGSGSSCPVADHLFELHPHSVYTLSVQQGSDTQLHFYTSLIEHHQLEVVTSHHR